MKLHTDLGTSTIDVFSKIILEAKMQRANDKTRIQTLIENKIHKYLCHYKSIPEILNLGDNEYKFFKDDFRYVSDQNEVIVLKIEKTAESSGITLTKPKNREAHYEI